MFRPGLLIRLLACACLSLGVSWRCDADTFTVEVMGGSALNLPAPLTVRQDGFPDIRVSSARYETRPFGSYPYYAWILTNPESTVRGREYHAEPGLFDRGNFFSGIGTRVGVARSIRLVDHLYLVSEAAFTAGFAWRVPIADGSSNVPNRSLHGHVGIGIGF